MCLFDFFGRRLLATWSENMELKCKAPAKMRSLAVRLLTTCAVLCSCAAASANQVFLYGVVKSSTVGGSSFIGQLWTFTGTYTPAPAAATASLTAATMTIGSETWNILVPDAPSATPPVISGLTMVTPSRLQITANFAPDSDPGNRGTGRSVFSLSVDGTPADNSGFASQANIDSILATSLLPQQGSYAIIESSFATESLTLQRTVPEPSTWALLVGVAGVGARRLLNRRKAVAAPSV
ncbi:MAG TPA: hypothetical protein DIT89_05075 [Planctomycetaceae bacterium]|nr:hypothetical protein [Planctomycetaceae bacterium]